MSTSRIPEDEAAEPTPPADAAPVYARVDISGRTLARIVLAALLTLAAMWLIASLGEVLVMIPLAVLIAVVLSVFVNWLERKGVKRGLAALLSLVGVLLVVGGVLAITIPPLVRELSEFLANLPSTAEGLRARLSGSPEVYNAIVNAIERLRRNPAELLSGALEFGFSVASVLFAGVLLLTLALYFLIDGERVRAAVLRLTPREYRARVEASMDGTAEVIRAYFIGQTIVSSIFAVFTFLLLTVLDVPYAAVFAALAFFLDAIPNIGATLANVIPATVALATRGLTTALVVVASVLVYQQIENNVIQPRVLSKRLNVPPVLTLIAILVGGKLLGVLGVILAIPVAGMLPVLERIWITPESEVKTPAQPEQRPRERPSGPPAAEPGEEGERGEGEAAA